MERISNKPRSPECANDHRSKNRSRYRDKHGNRDPDSLHRHHVSGDDIFGDAYKSSNPDRPHNGIKHEESYEREGYSERSSDASERADRVSRSSKKDHGRSKGTHDVFHEKSHRHIGSDEAREKHKDRHVKSSGCTKDCHEISSSEQDSSIERVHERSLERRHDDREEGNEYRHKLQGHREDRHERSRERLHDYRSDGHEHLHKKSDVSREGRYEQSRVKSRDSREGHEHSHDKSRDHREDDRSQEKSRDFREDRYECSHSHDLGEDRHEHSHEMLHGHREDKCKCSHQKSRCHKEATDGSIEGYQPSKERSYDSFNQREESIDKYEGSHEFRKDDKHVSSKSKSLRPEKSSLEVGDTEGRSHQIRNSFDAKDGRTMSLKKRKERERDTEVDIGGKHAKIGDEKRDRKRFSDKASKDKNLKRTETVLKTDSMHSDDEFTTAHVHGSRMEMYQNNELFEGSSVNGCSTTNGSNLESAELSNSIPGASTFPHPTKVSSISNKNENKGVNIESSHEVPGKSSTDGVSSAAGKSGSLSLDALAKAKKALQMQKELADKLKKIPLLNKSSSSSSDVKLISESKVSSGLQSQDAGSAQTLKSFSAPDAVAVSSSSAAASTTSTAPSTSSLFGSGTPNYEAVKRAQELAVKMGFRQDPQFAPLINLFPGQMATEYYGPQKPTKVPVLRVDALGREIDEHGNVINVTKPSNLSTLKVNINKQKKEAFQILKPELDYDPESNPHFDARMGIDKTKLLRPKRMNFQFVEEGKWSKEAEMLKLRSQFGEERARDIKARQALHAKAESAPDINPNLIEVSERIASKEKPKDPIPEVEWWDVPLLNTETYNVTDGIMAEDTLKMEKFTDHVEHPCPIEPPAEPAPPPPQPLKLTKKEQKKLRTQRRLAREKDKQEMIRQGLLEPPKPKVKMSNLMKVLGSEATQDPTRLEKEIRTAAAEREQAHMDRNIARKLTPAERREKKERKLFDDPSTLETLVSVYRINDLSDKKLRFKVDVNAHENRLTGCVVMLEGISVVVVEGGSKSIRRYGKLMLKRINWAETGTENEEDEKGTNGCALVWQGSVAKPSFHKFLLHECLTEAAARKIFSDNGVGHYWDLAIGFSQV